MTASHPERTLSAGTKEAGDLQSLRSLLKTARRIVGA
jgi:hypothetical protein